MIRIKYSGVKHLWSLAIVIWLCLVFFSSKAQNAKATVSLKGKVESEFGSDRAAFVTVMAQSAAQSFTVITNEQGEYIFKSILPGKYTLSFSSINFNLKKVELTITTDHVLNVKLTSQRRMLDEVYVTAFETKGKPSTSIIDRKAMQLLQPSSFTDLLELLPGGRAYNPNLTQMNQIRLREPSNAPSGYDISSLGTAFYIDGAPINTSANLQTTSGYTTSDPNGSRNAVNKGVDMRSIPTDQIEKVEITRGIPSVEFGDLTSGLINIERRKGSTPYTMRFKADGFSKLVSIGKGVSLLEKNLFINANVDYLDSKADPRDNFENYRRLTGSLRTEKYWERNNRRFTWNAAFDYATTVDNERIDPDNSYALTDSYTSTYKNFTLTNSFKFKFNKNSTFKTFDISTRLNYQHDVIDLTKWVQARTATVLINSLVPGAHDAKYVTPSYAADLDVEGKPLNAFVKATSTMELNFGQIKQLLRFGTEYNLSKNFGNGQQYHLDFPLELNATSTVRPRAFSDIPSLQSIAFFFEDGLKYEKGAHRFDLTAGARAMAVIGIDDRYDIANKPYIDPRFNFIWHLPTQVIANKKLEISMGLGFGLHHKLPTLDMLYPNKTYIDNVQLNYYHNNPEFRKVNAKTTILNTENYNLAAAMNKKLEINGDLNYNGYRLSFTLFKEKMLSGFRSSSRYVAVDYKHYNNTSIDANTITAKPNLEDFTFSDRREFYGYSIATNGSGMLKQGLEYQLTTKRISDINTRFTLSGAWFKNRYKGSAINYNIISTTVVTDNKVRQFIGVFDEDEGSDYQQFNTNLMVDSYLPKLGLMFSVSAQSLWFTSSKENYKTGVPISYIDINENAHPYTEASKNDQNLRWLLQNYSDTRFRENRVPINLQVNLKASKEFKNKARISMFVNRFLTYTPSYEAFGVRFFRQATSPYFGMELNFNL